MARLWPETHIQSGSRIPRPIKCNSMNLRNFPKHNIGIVGISQNAIVAAIEWATLCKFQA